MYMRLDPSDSSGAIRKKPISSDSERKSGIAVKDSSCFSVVACQYVLYV